MPRPLRLSFPFGVYHIATRGVDGRMIFLDRDDRRFCVKLIRRLRARYGIRVVSWCLMGNHLHLLIEAGQPAMSRAMQWFLGVYAQRFNRRHGRHGHLFQSRYTSRWIEDEDDLSDTTFYVLMNPVDAGLVRRPQDWPWSWPRVIGAIERTMRVPRSARARPPPQEQRPPLSCSS
jgi:REP element-mobilizing transposase RayT